MGLKVLSALVVAVITALDFIFKEHPATWVRVVQLVLAVVAFASFLDLIGVPIVRRMFEKLEAWLGKALFKLLHIVPNQE
jgi:hypothetical protein